MLHPFFRCTLPNLARAPWPPGQAHMQSTKVAIVGDVVRKTGPQSYAIHPTGGPGFIEVQCFTQQIREDMVDELHNADYQTYHYRLAPSVSVVLGPFCLKSGAFLNCALACPPAFEGTASPARPDPPARRPCWQRRLWL